MFILLFLLLMSNVVMADVYVLSAPDKSVVGLSEQKDMVVPSGYKIDIIKNKKISDLTVTMGEEKMYDFSGNKFTLNAKKVTDKNKSNQDAIIASQKRSADAQSAINKLKILGLTDSEIESLK